MSNEFTCAVCGETYEKAHTEEEAKEEFELLYPDEPFDEAELICEDCFQKFYAFMVDEEDKEEVAG